MKESLGENWKMSEKNVWRKGMKMKQLVTFKCKSWKSMIMSRWRD